MKITNFILFLVFLLPLCSHGSIFSGNAKLYPMINDSIYSQDTLKSVQGSFKLQYVETLKDNIHFETAYEVTSIYQKYLPTPMPSSSSAYRLKDFDQYLHEDHSLTTYQFNLLQNLNRLNVTLPLKGIDLSIGRQVLSFGSARSINPTDVLAPLSFYSLDKEEKPGVDAIIAKVPLNELSIIETGIVAGDGLKTDDSAFYLRPKLNWERFEFNLTAMRFKQSSLFGFDVQHPIKDAAFWFESALVRENQKVQNDFLRFTTGVDYKFKNSLYLCLEYHYNGAAYFTNLALHQNYIYLKDKNYTILTSSYEFTPLLLGSLNTFVNLNDQSSFSNLKIDYNYSDNIYLGLGSMLSFGDKVTSELGKLGKMYFSSLRYYF